MVMEDRGGMEGWTPSELSPGRFEATELLAVSLHRGREREREGGREYRHVHAPIQH